MSIIYDCIEKSLGMTFSKQEIKLAMTNSPLQWYKIFEFVVYLPVYNPFDARMKKGPNSY